MIKKMLVNATHPEENRVAIVEDGILSELDIEIAGKEQTKGNIYKATVIRVEQGLQAAFVDYGAERLGFLQMGEIHPTLFPKSAGEDAKNRPRINDILHRGQELLVQVTKEERGNKGAALTTFLSLPGRYMVLMPGDKTRGMSRKIPDGAERKQLKESIQQFDLPDEMGYIIRTAAIGQTAEELTRDLQYLLRVYNNILELSRKVKSPALTYRESNLMIRSIRDYFTQDMDEVLVDDPAVLKEAQDFFQQVMPEYARLVKLHQERRPIFSKYQIEDQIETISQKQVFMPGGGSIVIDSTEALVAIDVNSGKMAGETGVEGTAYKTNLEAASEVARQLRLRDLGGLVVIDFIDMRDRKHIREVEKRLKEALKSDKARVTVGRISQFGLLEMSRQRIKAALAEGSYLSCPNCQGTGRVRSTEAQAIAFLRKLHAAVARGQLERIEGEVPLAVSHYLLNNKREELVDMERRYQTSISIRGRKSFVADQTELTLVKRERDERKDSEVNAPVTAATALADQHEERQEVVNGDTAGDKPAKKSRSRRRSRKAAKTEQHGEVAATTKAAPESEPATPDTETTAEAEAGPAAAPFAEAVEKKPSRRRRSRRTKKPEPAETAESAESAATAQAPAEKPASIGEAPTGDQSVATDQPAAASGNEAAAEAKPARRRNSRRAKKPAESAVKTEESATSDKTETSPAAPTTASIATAVEPAVGQDAVAPAQADAPRKRRTRRSKKPAADAVETAATPATTSDVGQPATSSAEAPATAAGAAIEPPPAKPRRPRRPRKPTTDKVTGLQADSTPKNAPEPAASSTAEAEKKKPAPRRRKPAAKQPTEEANVVVAESAKEQPKRQRRSRRPAAEPAEAPPPAGESTE